MFGFIVESPDDWYRALEAISNGGNGGRTTKDYTITVKSTVYVDSEPNYTFGDAENIKVTMRGKGTLRLNTTGSLLRINENQTLVIDGPTLRGLDPNDIINGFSTLIYIYGNLELKSGSITGNNATYNSGRGGAVYIYESGKFIMNGGTISGNSVTSKNNSAGYGGGVHVDGTFIMNGGTISGNHATDTNNEKGYGGGVCVDTGGIFTMNGGTITDNYASTGSDVCYHNNGTFNRNGGSLNNDYVEFADFTTP